MKIRSISKLLAFVKTRGSRQVMALLLGFDFPTASETYANGIDESGTVVGWWDILDADGNLLAEHGFRWEKGNFSEVNFPGSADTLVWANNARGDLVGSWKTGVDLPDHGFVSSKKQFITFDVPFSGARDTVGGGTNACAEIVGQYNDVDGFGHGFLAVGATFTHPCSRPTVTTLNLLTGARKQINATLSLSHLASFGQDQQDRSRRDNVEILPYQTNRSLTCGTRSAIFKKTRSTHMTSGNMKLAQTQEPARTMRRMA